MNVNVEVVDFYPLTSKKNGQIVTGTIRVRLPDIGIHILGIYVSKCKGFYFFSMPGRDAVHHKTGEKIRFPCVVFEDQEKQKAMIEAIREKGREFIEALLADPNRPLVFPQEKETVSDEAKPAVESDDAPVAKKTVSRAKSEPVTKVSSGQVQSGRKMSKPEPAAKPAIAKKVWVDPPKRKLPARGTK